MFSETRAKFAILVLEPGEFEGVFHGEEKLVCGERLFEKIERTKASGFDGHFDIGLAGDENDRSLQAGFFQFFKEFHAGFTWHNNVGEDEIESLGSQRFRWRGWRCRRRWLRVRRDGKRERAKRGYWGRRR